MKPCAFDHMEPMALGGAVDIAVSSRCAHSITSRMESTSASTLAKKRVISIASVFMLSLRSSS